jgi:uncharacterized membrane protein
MPLARYFLLVGGALLLVFLVAGAWLPSLPAVERVEAQRATIRIHSEKKLPERVVFDTSAPTVAHPIAPMMAAPAAPSPPSAADVSAKARQAFAQLQSSDAGRANVAEPKRPESKSTTSRKSETRKRAAAPRKIRLARQPQFDWFGGRMWW